MSGIRQLDHEPCRCPGFLFTMLARARRSRSVASFEQRERVLRAPRQKNAGIGRGERRDAVGRPSIGGADWEPHEETGWVCIKQEQRPLLHASNFAGVQELDDFEFALRLCFFPVGGVLSKPEGYALSRGNEAIELSDAVLNISRW